MATISNTDYVRTIPERLVKSEKGSKQTNARQEFLSLAGISAVGREDNQGYYGLLTDYYFTSGLGTNTEIELEDINIWTDVNMVVATEGLFDKRTTAMREAVDVGHTGTGLAGSPVVFDLEGLTTDSYGNFRASMEFTPDEDGGQVDTRIFFTRHTGSTPSEPFPIEEVTLSMQQGADIAYVAEPMLSFFVGDTIDTNGVGDAGSFKFQFKTNVPGTLTMRALTFYIHQ